MSGPSNHSLTISDAPPQACTGIAMTKPAASNNPGKLRRSYHHDSVLSVLVALIVCTADSATDDGSYGDKRNLGQRESVFV